MRKTFSGKSAAGALTGGIAVLRTAGEGTGGIMLGSADLQNADLLVHNFFDPHLRVTRSVLRPVFVARPWTNPTQKHQTT
jgi:hypothetical protein